MFSKNQSPREEFNESIEGIGDILVFHTKLKHNDEVIPGLNDLRNLLIELLKLRDSNPSAFDRLMLDEEYWKVLKKNKEEAQLKLSFYPKKYLITFSRLIEQLLRVIDASLRSGNREITLQATSQLSLYLRSVSKMEGADLLVRQVLRALYETTRRVIAVNSRVAGPAVYEWYSFVVFDRRVKKSKVLYKNYLGDLDKYLFENIKYLIDNSEFDLFKEFVSHSIDGIHVPSHKLNDMYDIHDILRLEDFDKYRELVGQHNTGKRIRALIDDAKTLYAYEDYRKWELRVDELKGDLYSQISRSSKIKLTKLINEIKEAALLVFANNSLKSLFFTIASWIVYTKKLTKKEKATFIKEIWTHKNPGDSNAVHGGNDIYPKDLGQTVLYFFSNESPSFPFFWEDHHSASSYKNKYFLYLLLWHLRRIVPATQFGIESSESADEDSSVEIYPDIDQFSLPFELATELSSVKYRVDKLLEDDIPQLKKDPLTKELIPNFDLDIKSKLIPLLNKISSDAQEKIEAKEVDQPLSQRKVDEFRNSFLKAYEKTVLFRRLFEGVSSLENKVESEELVDFQLVGFNRLEDRALFFEDWHVGYSNWGEDYGQGMAEGEDRRILESIVSNLENTKNENISEVLEEHGATNNTVIFASSETIYDYFEGHENYIPYWQEITNEEREPYLAGWFQHNELKIKIFNYHLEKKNYYFAIFNLDGVGKFVQEYPLLERDLPEHKSYLFKHFRIMIGDFATDNDLVNRFLENPPQWLSDRGNNEQQEEFLSSKLLLQIGEKFKLVSEDGNMGKIYIKE